MEVIGYKCFNKGLINKYGKKFSIGKIYIDYGSIKFGLRDNGFHLCKNLEDTFRYFDALNNEVDICLVKGYGVIDEGYDEYYGYYDMYSVEKIEILKQLSRFEIINIGLNLQALRAQRFVSTFKLTKFEIELFIQKYKNYCNVIDAISYYQLEDKNIYQKKLNNN